MARTAADRSDLLASLTMPAESDTAIVAFSNKLLRPGRFHFENLLETFPNASRLLIRDPGESWYNGGLPGIGETVEEIAAWTKRELDALDARRVVTIGTSMGGYAAILFGCMISAERVVAIAPQTLLDQRLPAFAPPTHLQVQAPDLLPVVSEAPQTRVDVVVGRDSLLDAFHAHRIAGAGSVRLLGVPLSGHYMAKKLNREGRLGALIAELCEGGMPSICEVEPPLEHKLLDRLGDGLFAWRKDWPVVRRAITPVADRHRDWPALQAAVAHAAAELADWDGFRDALAAAGQAGPAGSRLRTRIDQATTFAEEKRFEDAGDALNGLMEC
jgi:pimeloyl-ACP methyl ester carboxylesterase